MLCYLFLFIPLFSSAKGEKNHRAYLLDIFIQNIYNKSTYIEKIKILATLQLYAICASKENTEILENSSDFLDSQDYILRNKAHSVYYRLFGLIANVFKGATTCNIQEKIKYQKAEIESIFDFTNKLDHDLFVYLEKRFDLPVKLIEHFDNFKLIYKEVKERIEAAKLLKEQKKDLHKLLKALDLLNSDADLNCDSSLQYLIINISNSYSY